jgi:hypothetical protein
MVKVWNLVKEGIDRLECYIEEKKNRRMEKSNFYKEGIEKTDIIR